MSLSMSRIAEEITSAVTNREKMVKSSEAERKERMDTSSLMEQILSSDNLNSKHLIFSLELFCDTVLFSKFFYKPKEHFLRLLIHISKVFVQFISCQ